jgi:SOS-response transcriptional repressor LexA
MLSEGWDVKNVSHVIGFRAFGSPLLTEQVIGRGLRRNDYTVLNQPIEERLANDNRPDEETVDAFGIPFLGFPVERRKRPKAGRWGQKPVSIEPDAKKVAHGVRVPNVRSWAVGVSEALTDAIDVDSLDQLVISSKETPTQVRVRPVIGGAPEELMTLEEFRDEFPLLRSIFILARELFEAVNPGDAADRGIGPTFEEILDFVTAYVSRRVRTEGSSEKQDIGMYFWTRRALDILETAVQGAPSGTTTVPIFGSPQWLDSGNVKRFSWTGITSKGKKCHLSLVPCHTDLEGEFADYLDRAQDVLRYFKNERLGFSITYYENNRPRQYYPDFIVLVKEPDGREVWWLAETKGEIRPSTQLKREAADLWCERMSRSGHGSWRHLFVPQRRFHKESSKVKGFNALANALVRGGPEPQLELIPSDDPRVTGEAYKSLLPLYSLEAAAGYFGEGKAVDLEGGVGSESLGRLDEGMFVAKAIGRSMEPRIYDGDYLIFRANPTGTRQGKIVLAQGSIIDPELGGPFTVKKYVSEKVPDPDGGWKHSRVRLVPLNPEFDPIELRQSEADDEQVRIVAEYLGKLKP